ncbi:MULTISPECIES: TetR/AcrR family transcriptional regulator [Amycolatopsis]|nr:MULTISPECIES: TetR/AcrR family transcriptional regulator [Amycolatopsis]
MSKSSLPSRRFGRSGKRLRPRPEPQRVRGEPTRQRILAAAARIFAERGYAAGTTNRIAERAPVSIGSLYQYYPDKDAILVALAARKPCAATGKPPGRRRRSTGRSANSCTWPSPTTSTIRSCWA